MLVKNIYPKILLPLMLTGIMLLGGCVTNSQFTQQEPQMSSIDQSAPSSFAAIAYSPSTKKWRMHWNIPTQAQAIKMVMAKCTEADCRPILVYGPGVCGTFSLGSNNALGVGVGITEADAKKTALAGCSTIGGNCKVAKPRCNY